MKSVSIKFQFDDQFYQELSELAESLDISIGELIAQFFEEGVSFSWGAFEHEAKKKQRF